MIVLRDLFSISSNCFLVLKSSNWVNYVTDVYSESFTNLKLLIKVLIYIWLKNFTKKLVKQLIVIFLN